jgi:hypothetical protein
LPQLWHGSWSGLALAIGFAALANALLLATFVWVELANPRFLQYGWMAAASLWIGSAAASAVLGHGVGRRALSSEAMFQHALHEYLKGNWFEVERTLRRLLRWCPRDIEARLLLATLLRRTARHAEALEELARLELLCDASKWAAEIAAEKRTIAQAQPAADTAHASPAIATSSPAAPSRAA